MAQLTEIIEKRLNVLRMTAAGNEQEQIRRVLNVDVDEALHQIVRKMLRMIEPSFFSRHPELSQQTHISWLSLIQQHPARYSDIAHRYEAGMRLKYQYIAFDEDRNIAWAHFEIGTDIRFSACLESFMLQHEICTVGHLVKHSRRDFVYLGCPEPDIGDLEATNSHYGLSLALMSLFAEDPMPDGARTMDISTLPLSRRSTYSLREAQIKTVEQLCMYSEVELRKKLLLPIRCVGEIKEHLNHYGLNLREN